MSNVVGKLLFEALVAAAEAEPDLAKRALLAFGVRAPGADSELVKLRDVGVPVRTLRAGIAKGELTAVRVGREYLVRRKDLDDWLDRARVKTRTPKPCVTEQSAADRAIARARSEGRLRVVRRVP